MINLETLSIICHNLSTNKRDMSRQHIKKDKVMIKKMVKRKEKVEEKPKER